MTPWTSARWRAVAILATAAIAAVVVTTWRVASRPALLERTATPVPALVPDPATADATEGNEAAPTVGAESLTALPSAAFECGSGPCEQLEFTEPPPVETAPVPALRPLPADMDAWALDPQVDPDWRPTGDGRPETLGNLPPDPEEFDPAPADEGQDTGYPSPSDG